MCVLGEQLAMEMERNRLTILGVTETHMPGSGVHTQLFMRTKSIG